jgi:hypothetical protein
MAVNVTGFAGEGRAAARSWAVSPAAANFINADPGRRFLTRFYVTGIYEIPSRRVRRDLALTAVHRRVRPSDLFTPERCRHEGKECIDDHRKSD